MTKPKPLVIFVGEQHDNMAYGSLVENLTKYSESRGLNVQIFSEYESQTQKIGMETTLRNQATDPLAFEETTKFLDSRFIKMGDLAEREKIMAESLQRYKDQGFTPRQLFEQTKPQMVVAPEIYGMMESDLRDGESTGSVNGKPFNLDNFYHSYRAQFNHGAVHSAMLNDLRAARNIDTDVVVVVSGLGHTYGLNQELSEFEGCQKLVITNFLDNVITDPVRRGEIKKAESSAQIGIGGLLEFDVDPITKIASIPDIVREKLDEKSLTKKQSLELEQRNSYHGVLTSPFLEEEKASITSDRAVSALDSETAAKLSAIADLMKESGIKFEEVGNNDKSSRSFVERMRSDPTKGKSPGGAHEL